MTNRKAGQPVNEDSSDDAIRDRAREIYARLVDEEIDIDQDAAVSRGGDDGAFVAAWVWVPFEEVTDGQEG